MKFVQIIFRRPHPSHRRCTRELYIILAVYHLPPPGKAFVCANNTTSGRGGACSSRFVSYVIFYGSTKALPYDKVRAYIITSGRGWRPRHPAKNEEIYRNITSVYVKTGIPDCPSIQYHLCEYKRATNGRPYGVPISFGKDDIPLQMR